MIGVEEDEQLLDGVALVQSISCIENSGSHRKLEEAIEGHNTLIEQVELDFLLSPNSDFSPMEPSRLPPQELRNTTKMNPPRKSYAVTEKKGAPQKPLKWNKFQGLNEQALKMDTTDALEKCFDVTQKLRKMIILEEYSKIKLLQERFDEQLEQLTTILESYQNERIQTQKHLNQTQKVNQELMEANQELFKMIQSLRQKFQEHREYTHVNSNSKIQSRLPAVLDTPILSLNYVRSFSHSLDELNLMQAINQEKQAHFQPEPEGWIQIVFVINQKLKSISNGEKEGLNIDQSLIRKVCAGQSVTQWLKEIGQKLEELSARKAKRVTVTEFHTKRSKTTMSDFLEELDSYTKIFKTMCRSNPNELQRVQLLLITTFIGILINESQGLALPERRTNIEQFWKKVNLLELRSCCHITEDNKDYNLLMEKMTYDINELL